jgi:hypothetical protein
VALAAGAALDLAGASFVAVTRYESEAIARRPCRTALRPRFHNVPSGLENLKWTAVVNKATALFFSSPVTDCSDWSGFGAQ